MDVEDSNNTNATAITCSTGCVNSTGNTNWIFPVTGVLYGADGVTPLASEVIALSINGAAIYGTATTQADGSYSLNPGTLSAGQVLTLYVSGDSGVKAVTVTVTNGTNTANMDLMKDALLVRHENAGPVANANLATGENNGDGDISALYQVSGGVLTMQGGKKLWIRTSSTFAPGGAVNAGDIRIDGTFAMAGNAVNVSGSWMNRGTVTGSNTVTFTGNGTITKGASSFSSLVLNHSGGLWSSSGALSASTLTITAGTLDLSGSALTVTGTFTNNDTLRLRGNETTTGFANDASHGTVLFNGGGSYSGLSGLTSFNNLTMSGAGTWTLNNPVTVNGNLAMTKGTLAQNGKQITVSGNWSDASPAVFTSSGTTVFTGNAAITEPKGL